MNAILALATTGGASSSAPAGPALRQGLETERVALAAALAQVGALLIDPENVLYDATLWRRWLRQLLARMGVPAAFPEFFHPWDRQFREEVDLGRRDFAEAFHDFLAHAGLSEAQIAETLAAALCRKRRFESDLRSLPGVNETLTRLAAAGVSLYVLANSPRRWDELLRDLEQMGLRGVFRGGLTSREIGETVPGPRCRRAVVERWGLDLSQTAVAASQGHILAGVRRWGASTVAFNADDESAADVVLERFPDLAAWIRPPAWTKLAG